MSKLQKYYNIDHNFQQEQAVAVRKQSIQHAPQDEAAQNSNVLIKCTAQDVKDYLQYKQAYERTLSTSFNNLWDKVKYSLQTKTEKDIEAEHARGSFNDFVKYRYYTSELFEPEQADLINFNLIADISALDLSSLNFMDGNFDGVYAIGTIFSNSSIHCTTFKDAKMPCSIFNNSTIVYSDFSGANLYGANLEDVTSGWNTIDAKTVTYKTTGKLELDVEFAWPSLPENSLQKIHNLLENSKAEVMHCADVAVSTIGTAAYNIKGAILGGIAGVATTNVAMGMYIPTVGAAVAFNLSAVGAFYGTVEGYRYYNGSNNSLILTAQKMLYGEKDIAKSHIPSHLTLSPETEEALKSDQYTLAILKEYDATPVLTIESSSGWLDPKMALINFDDNYSSIVEIEQEIEYEKGEWLVIEKGGIRAININDQDDIDDAEMGDEANNALLLNPILMLQAGTELEEEKYPANDEQVVAISYSSHAHYHMDNTASYDGEWDIILPSNYLTLGLSGQESGSSAILAY
jgi:hypothetical protein